MTIEVDIRVQRGARVVATSFHISEPGITALFGPSGAGKTTVIEAIAGLVRPQSGRIAFNGRSVFDAGKHIDLPPRKRRVGCVFQDSRLFPHMTVEKNLLFGWRRSGKRADEAEIRSVTAMLGIDSLLARRPPTLSGGEKQRVAIGRALLSSPELLLLDEPMASLDLQRKDEILPFLERLRDDVRVPIVYVSHSTEEIARLASHVVVLEDGAVARSGSIFDILPEIDARGGTVLQASIVAHRPDGLSEVEFGGGRLVVQRLAQPPGSRLRLRIAASDLMISLHRLDGVSANNVIAAEISALKEIPNGLVDVVLQAGPERIVARITGASSARLSLAPGLKVYAVVKAVTVDTTLGITA
ncbi:MAG: molybdenum ABC transporter ATP-binding protein [Alphaproteobacteria bacterium]|nr:molybdenum ABC transporter ATP-binding protein [Alphaproteobacteria bacterium]